MLCHVQHDMFTVIHKHYTLTEWQKFNSEVSTDIFKVSRTTGRRGSLKPLQLVISRELKILCVINEIPLVNFGYS